MKLITNSGVQHNAFEIHVERGGSCAPLVLYSTAADVDTTAKRLSAMIPQERVRVEHGARIKATYLNGKRREVRDYKDFYSNLTDAEYQATKIWCGTKAEWI